MLYYVLGNVVVDKIEVSLAPERDEAFFCSSCGSIWGRVLVNSPGRRWFIVSRGCKAAHARDGLDAPGSLILDRSPGSIWPVGHSLVLRELDLAASGAGLAFPHSSRYNYDSRTMEPVQMEPELFDRIAALRVKALEGTLTDQEVAEALVLLRNDRRFAAAQVGAAKKKPAGPPIDTDALLKSFF